MKFAELFLYTDNCYSFGIYIACKNNCEGCYIAAQIVSALYKRQYNIIGQKFSYDLASGDEYGSFAIRTSKNSRYFNNLDESKNRLILPGIWLCRYNRASVGY